MVRHRHVKKIVKYVSDFAIHIWIILLLANVLLVYTFHFYLHAASQPENVVASLENSSDIQSFQADENTQPDETEETPPTLTPEPMEEVPRVPNGPLLALSFSVPGIGSGGGNLKPIHPTRNVTIYLYPLGVNSSDKKIRPVNTIQTKAYYDANESSPTYTRFINPKIDLGSKVADGQYQVVIKTDKSFRQLIKEKLSNVGGIVYDIEKRKEGDDIPELPHQTMVMGDLFPLDEGDNAADLNDYAVLVNCFQQKHGNPSCPDPNDADITDDGKVDGLDYNVMVISYGVLKEQGITIPKLLIPPTGANVSRLSYLTPKLTKAPSTPTPTFVPDKPKEEGGGGIGGLLVFILFLGILGGGGFFLYLKNPKVKAMIDRIIHRSSKPPVPQNQPISAPQAGDQTTENVTPAQSPEQTPSVATPAASPTSPVTAPSQPEPAKPAASNPSVDSGQGAADAGQAKEYFVKKQSEDETKTGFWLTLTDDNGPTLAHYKGTEVTDGFANIKGEMKTENGKTFLEITELVPEQ